MDFKFNNISYLHCKYYNVPRYHSICHLQVVYVVLQHIQYPIHRIAYNFDVYVREYIKYISLIYI